MLDLLTGTEMRTAALVIGRVVFRVPELPGWRRRVLCAQSRQLALLA